MLTRDQYEILNEIRKRADSTGKIRLEQMTYNRDDIWRFFKENHFIENMFEADFSFITFKGCVALAAYEAQHENS